MTEKNAKANLRSLPTHSPGLVLLFKFQYRVVVDVQIIHQAERHITIFTVQLKLDKCVRLLNRRF